MCGIFGSISNNKIEIIKNLSPHRGPDDWGVVYSNTGSKEITLFQSRLSIIGLGEQGHQPFRKYNPYILIFNGEIYNYKLLQSRIIEEFSINFSTSTDSEVLYESLINYGLDRTLEKINGIFSFAFADLINNKLFIVRDNLGIKPLYYINNETAFCFSSEIKVFFELGLLEPELRKELLGEYFANGWIYEPDTLFKNVFKLEAGCYIEYDLDKHSSQIKRYWDVNNSSSVLVDNNYISKVIREQTISDVPIGVYFSGGIDSSIIAYELIDTKPFFLNLDLKDSESERVNLFREKYNINIYKSYYSQNEFVTYEKLIYYLDEPIADPAVIPAYNLAKISREHNKIVMMSGMGGDEIDAGYNRHKILFNLKFYSLIKFLPLLPFLPGKIKRDINRLKSFAKDPGYNNYFSLTAYYTLNEISTLINDKNWFSLYTKKINNMTEKIKDKIKKYFYLEFKGFLSSHNLIYMDKASMAASVEVRVPLLEKNIVNHFFNTIIANQSSKSLKPRLCNNLKSSLGKDFKQIKKQGFRFPVDEWMTKYVNWEEIQLFFKDKKIIREDLLLSYVILLKKDPSNYSMKLFYIYTLYLWLKTFNVKVM